MNDSKRLSTRCCIAGGGPAGMMLAYILARAGIDVVVLEKHADFLRDFRGDTVHPSTLEIMYELGLLDEFLKQPHQEFTSLVAQIGDVAVRAVDFSHLPTHAKFLVLMPQWDFLNFLASHAKRYPGFRLLMQTSATDLLIKSDAILGVRANGPDGPLEIGAEIVVAADGRHSILREQSHLPLEDIGAPMDVLWFRLPRSPQDPEGVFRANSGRIFVSFSRGDYWQCGVVIRKGGLEQIQRAGLPSFRSDVVAMAPFFADRVDTLKDWQDIKLLTVMVNRLQRWWRPGLLCIGDAAHAMSPIGGVGINLAIQDAVAAANMLVPAFRRGGVSASDLQQLQQRRAWPTRVTQSFQVFIQKRIIGRFLSGNGPQKAPLFIRIIRRWPALARVTARLIGLGARPEHVRV